MASDTLKTVAERLVECCRTGQEEQALAELYADDVQSIEPFPGPDGGDRVHGGMKALKAKHAWWAENFEVHGGNVEGPFLNGDDQFTVIFDIDATDRASGGRMQMREVALYKLDDAGKIASETFFMMAM